MHWRIAVTFNNEEWTQRQEASDADRRDYERERLILWTTELLADLMSKSNVTKADLARKLGTSRAYVTQLLSGSRNVTLNTLADAAWALGQRASVRMEPMQQGAYISSPVVPVWRGTPTVVRMREENQACNDVVHESAELMCAGAM
jgi:predicted transcriptional regulator